MEGCGRNEGLGLQAGLSNTEQDRCCFSRLPAFFKSLLVDELKFIGIKLFANQQGCIARLSNLNLAQHLRNDNFNVLIVNLNTLHTVNVLNFFNEIFGQFFNT